MDDFQNQIRDAVKRYIKNIVTNVPSNYGIPVVQIERAIGEVNKCLEIELKSRFIQDFGVIVTGGGYWNY